MLSKEASLFDSRHATREDAAIAGSTSGSGNTIPSPTKQEEVPNTTVAVEPEEMVDELPEQQGKAKSKKSRIARLSVNFDSLKKITSLGTCTTLILCVRDMALSLFNHSA